MAGEIGEGVSNEFKEPGNDPKEIIEESKGPGSDVKEVVKEFEETAKEFEEAVKEFKEPGKVVKDQSKGKVIDQTPVRGRKAVTPKATPRSSVKRKLQEENLEKEVESKKSKVAKTPVKT